MNLPWRGGFLFLAILAPQDPAPPPPDLVARFAEILVKGPENRRDLAARALLSLGRAGHEAFRKALAAHPELATSTPPPGDPPSLSLVRFPRSSKHDQTAKDALTVNLPGVLARCPIEAEHILWEALEASDGLADAQARSALRALYAVPRDPVEPVVAPSLTKELDRRRSFDVTDRPLADVLGGESFSWILMTPRTDRITLKLRDVSLRDFLRVAAPDLAAVPVFELLLLIPPDRVASVIPPLGVWAPLDLAPKLESALDALSRGETAPIKALTGVPVYHALRRSLDLSPEAARLAEDLRTQLQQRVFFVGDREVLKGTWVTLEPKGRKTSDVLAEFEGLAKRAVAVRSPDALDQRAPDFRFRDIAGELAARALEFRLNYLR